MHPNLKNTVFLDFETRSQVDIKATGAWRYSEDSSTELLCLVWAFEDQAPKLYIPPEFNDSIFYKTETFNNFINEFKNFLANPQIVFVAHNAFFEKSLWHNVLHKRHGIFDIPAERWRCSAAVTASFALPRALGNASIALGLDHQKDDDGHRIMMQLAKPKLDKKTNTHIFNQHENNCHKFEKLYEYCLKDVEAERDLWRTLRPLSDQELDIWQLDQQINWRGLTIDKELAAAAAELAEVDDENLNCRLHVLTNGEVQRATNVACLLDWVNRRVHGVLMDVTKKSIADLLAKPEVIHTDKEKVIEALKIRQQVGKTSVAKFAAMMEAISSDNRLRDILMYHGASTGRWTGKLVQLQNLPRGMFKSAEQQEEAIALIKQKDLKKLREKYGSVKDVLSSCIRGLIVASPNHTLYVGDYASIEARVLFWVAGHEEGLKMYREGKDLYKHMAMKIYHIADEKDVTPDQRQLGKQAILGCGYGMGAKKFRDTCLGYGMEVSEELAEEVKDAYRTLHNPVQIFWGKIETAAISAVETGKKIECGKISFGVIGNFLHCKLPSGRLLSYYRPVVRHTTTPWGSASKKLEFYAENAVSRKFIREATYGGKLTENIVQAISRDIMAHAMLECERVGFKILLTVHDELITEAQDDMNFREIKRPFNPTLILPKWSKEIFENLMAQTPQWAEGCPVAVEAWSGQRYRK